MKIKYTWHAKNRMRKHNISPQEIELCLTNPEWIEPSVEGRNNAWLRIGEKFLRTTYKEEGTQMELYLLY